MQRCPNCGVEDMGMVGFPDQLIHEHVPYFNTATSWMTPDPDLHTNKGLPPVDCPLLIKVPAGIRFPHFESGRIWELEVPVMLRVRREHWERSKDATPTYIDEFGNKITGKFEWTYP